VAAVARVDSDVVFSLSDSHRVLRFCCQSADAAARVFMVACRFSSADSALAEPHTLSAARS
jgi:hypothetical protein